MKSAEAMRRVVVPSDSVANCFLFDFYEDIKSFNSKISNSSTSIIGKVGNTF